MDTEFLKKHLDRLLAEAVDSGVFPGASALVLDDTGIRYRKCVGYARVAEKKPVAEDTFFRMFSSSKNTAAVAASICIERGLLSRCAPVSAYLPAFKNVTVGPERRAPAGQIGVGDVLSMASGFNYDYDWSNAPKEMDTIAFVNDLASRQPLQFDPGDHWEYGWGADIAGALVETVTGKKYGQFLREEIFEPLGMSETGFSIPDAKRDRLADAHVADGEGCRSFRVCPEAGRYFGMNDYREDTILEGGGAGLVSTIDDWARFSRMLLDGGRYKGGRILSPAGFRSMLETPLTERQARTFTWENCTGHAYSTFFHVKRPGARHSDLTSPGTFAWGGWLGTTSWVDPVTRTSGILLIQRAGDDPIQLIDRFRNVVSAAASM